MVGQAYRIQSVLFQRTKDAPMEPGLLFDEGNGPILDANCKSPAQVWNYQFDRLIDLDLGHVFNKHRFAVEYLVRASEPGFIAAKSTTIPTHLLDHLQKLHDQVGADRKNVTMLLEAGMKLVAVLSPAPFTPQNIERLKAVHNHLNLAMLELEAVRSDVYTQPTKS